MKIWTVGIGNNTIQPPCTGTRSASGFLHMTCFEIRHSWRNITHNYITHLIKLSLHLVSYLYFFFTYLSCQCAFLWKFPTKGGNISPYNMSKRIPSQALVTSTCTYLLIGSSVILLFLGKDKSSNQQFSKETDVITCASM